MSDQKLAPGDVPVTIYLVPGSRIYRYQFRVNGERVRKSTKRWDKKAAWKVALKAYNEHLDGTQLKKPRSVSLQSFLDAFLEKHERDARNGHRKAYFKCFVGFMPEDCKAHNVTKKDAERFMLYLTRSKPDGRGLHLATVNGYMGNLAQAFKEMMADYNLKENPFGWFKRTDEIQFARERYLEPEERSNLIQLLYTKYHELFKVVLVAINTGMRFGDIVNLKWEYISLSRSMAFLPGIRTKEKKTRRFPLNRQVMEILTALPKRGEFVFTNLNGSKLSKAGFFKTQWRNVRKEAGLKNFRFHDLRHEFATSVLNSGGDLKKIGLAIGHSSERMTARYAHLFDETLRNQVEKLPDYREYLTAETAKRKTATISNDLTVRFSAN